MSNRRPIRLGVLTLFVLGLAAAQATAWGPAVHEYVADHSGRRWPFLNRIEMYGAALPDMCYFAYQRGPIFQQACADVIHDMFYPAVWEEAFNWKTRALGYGYESHHEADITAHEAGILIGRNGGYVIRKAALLAAVLGPQLSALELTPEQISGVTHNLVEVATDILVARVDPNIGNRLSFAALVRGPFVPEYLATVYAPHLEPTDLFLAEAEFRGAMIAYGQALAQDEDTTITLLTDEFAGLAGNWGIPPETPGLTVLIEKALRTSMLLCADLPIELAATTFAVRVRLWRQGIIY